MKEEARNRAPVERLVMWGEYKVTNYEGLYDFSNWEFGEETPWIACEDDEFQVVTPNWAFVDDGMNYMMAGISFISMIERYKRTFLDEEDGEEEIERERESAIACLKKAISILEAT